jgi:hypothetical protein
MFGAVMAAIIWWWMKAKQVNPAGLQETTHPPAFAPANAGGFLFEENQTLRNGVAVARIGPVFAGFQFLVPTVRSD